MEWNLSPLRSVCSPHRLVWSLSFLSPELALTLCSYSFQALWESHLQECR